MTLLFTLMPTSTLWAASTTDNVKAHYLPASTAEKFGRLNILYNSRICPVQTVAIDFTKKLYGARSYKGLTAEQVFTGWIFWGEEWMDEPILKMKDGEMKQTLQLPDYVSANNFFNNDMGGYVIGPYVKEYYEGNHDKFHTQVASVDDKIQLLMDLRRGLLLKIFPNTVKANTTWYAPTEDLPKTINAEHQRFMQTIFTLLFDEAEAGNYKQMDEMIGKIQKYQTLNAGTSLPTAHSGLLRDDRGHAELALRLDGSQSGYCLLAYDPVHPGRLHLWRPDGPDGILSGLGAEPFACLSPDLGVPFHAGHHPAWGGTGGYLERDRRISHLYRRGGGAVLREVLPQQAAAPAASGR